MIIAQAITPPGLNAQDKALMLAEVRRILWGWFFNHESDVIVRKHILFFNLTVTVGQLRGLFQDLLGDPPTPGLTV